MLCATCSSKRLAERSDSGADDSSHQPPKKKKKKRALHKYPDAHKAIFAEDHQRLVQKATGAEARGEISGLHSVNDTLKYCRERYPGLFPPELSVETVRPWLARLTGKEATSHAE